MGDPKVVFHPIISSIQKIALYETKARFYLIGSNNTQTRFRVLKIDRMEPHALSVIDDKVEYSQEEIRDLVAMIDAGNRTRTGPRSSGTGVAKVVSAFGIVGDKKTNSDKERDTETVAASSRTKQSVWRSIWKRNTFPRLVPAFGLLGFVKFLEGYYIILVTKRRRVAYVGYHTIYKIEDTSMIYIPNDGIRVSHPDEQRYLKMFQNIDLSSNFYFSYSYDITHTLQNNMAPPRNIIPAYVAPDGRPPVKNSPLVPACRPRTSEWVVYFTSDSGDSNPVQAADDFLPFWEFSPGREKKVSPDSVPRTVETVDYGVRNKPNRRFVWNSYMLRNIEAGLHPDWILYVMHGFVGQSNMSIFGRSIYVTIIARRSNKYAGTRFLKRGANFEGDVANEVETEQMVHDSGVSSLSAGRFSSFVQLRGSVPSQWSQDVSKMVPKPAISYDLSDPFCETAGEHFNQLLKRYGSPICILNLVKKREKKKHESMLSEEFSMAIKYLNQFLPSDHHIQYISFDMARMNKGKEANVMGKLARIAHNAICKTGIFQNQAPYNSQNPQCILGRPNGVQGRMQTGVIRVNCVDCLDRTNTAQFALGKCALGFQACALGVLESPTLEFDSDCVRMLEELYEDHGDTLALQYGGSQLVHRIKTYRKTAPWTSQGNDIMQTLSRYYSNTFSDAEKQHTINLFLGLFIPQENKPPIWELMTDYYLHHPQALGKKKLRRIPQSQWWDTEVLHCLPRAYDEVFKCCSEVVRVSRYEEMVDGYHDYHRPYEFSLLSDTFAYKISHSVRDFMPHFTTNFSPFTVRVRPGRRREETSSKGGTMKNPSLTGQSSTSSTTSSASSSSESEESGDDDENGRNTDSQLTPSKDSSSGNITFESLFPSMREVYGMEIEQPKKSDICMYKRYVLIDRCAMKQDKVMNFTKTVKFIQQSAFSLDTSYQVLPPRVNKASQEIYRQYVEKGILGASDPSPTDLMKYQKYVSNTILQRREWDDLL